MKNLKKLLKQTLTYPTSSQAAASRISLSNNSSIKGFGKDSVKLSQADSYLSVSK